jgi:hypothetical protein
MNFINTSTEIANLIIKFYVLYETRKYYEMKTTNRHHLRIGLRESETNILTVQFVVYVTISLIKVDRINLVEHHCESHTSHIPE